MFLNYLKVTVRSLLKNKGYSLINVTGLAIGLACFALIWVFIQNERSYDNFHPDEERLFRVVGILEEPGIGEYHNAITQGILAPTMARELTDVETVARLLPNRSMFMSRGATSFFEDYVMYADPAILDLLSIELFSGDRRTALAAPNSIVIDQETAEKYFGGEDPLGHHLNLSVPDGVVPLAVTGVMRNYPKNSHTGFSILVSFVTGEPERPYLQRWNTNALTTYVKLKKGAHKEDVDSQISAMVHRHLPEDDSRKRAYYLQPVRDIHLESGHILYQINQNQGSAAMLRLFAAIGLFVLLIASINYMNLATARSIKRAKEVGVRKVLGSDRRDLILRFVGESVVTTLLGFLLALVVIEVAFSGFASILGPRLVYDTHHSSAFYLLLAGVSLVVGAVSGIYPAFVLSSFQPAQALRGKAARGRGGATLRKGLVFAQFSIAIILLACTGIVQDQMAYIRGKDIGFDKSQLMYVPLRSSESRLRFPAMKDALLGNTSVEAVSAGGGIAGAGGSDGTMIVAGTNRQVTLMMRFSPVDYDFPGTMGLSVVQGREFDRRIPSDSATGVMLNEAAVRELGWKDPIGKQFEQESGPPLNVIGVVNDYHYFSLYVKLQPQLIYVNRNGLRHMLVKVAPRNVEQAVADVERVWKEHMPGEPFSHGFVDEAFDRMYRSDQNTHRLFIGFSVVAILVGCLGLFGLSSYSAEQRTKEIGIRKTLGASTSSLVFRLSSEFVRLVALSSLVAFPVAYWAMQSWLQDFAYRTSISPVSFLLAGGIVVLIAFVTVSFQAAKAALANPVQSLRYE